MEERRGDHTQREQTNQSTIPDSRREKEAIATCAPDGRSVTPKAQGTQKWQMTMARKGFTYLPGNSVSEVGERMKGGAVKEDKSPENEAILINVQGYEGQWELPRDQGGT